MSPNRVRAALTNEYGLTVYPRVLSAVYQSMTRSGHLQFDRWIENDDVAGGNAGKPARQYVLTSYKGAIPAGASA